jgi:hypothetical protein
MSAFIVSKEHIDAMVRVGIAGPSDPHEIRPDRAWHGVSWFTSDPRAIAYDGSNPTAYFGGLDAIRRELRSETAEATGAMLVAANVASVQHRYSEPGDDLPGPVVKYWTRPYVAPVIFRRQLPTAVEALKLIACYEYQSCEPPTWDGSEAQRFCDALRHALIGALPGYAEAPWELRAA